jgi:hypothetical protein
MREISSLPDHHLDNGGDHFLASDRSRQNLPFLMGVGRSFVLLLLNLGVLQQECRHWGWNGATAFARSLNKCDEDTQMKIHKRQIQFLPGFAAATH